MICLDYYGLHSVQVQHVVRITREIQLRKLNVRNGKSLLLNSQMKM